MFLVTVYLSREVFIILLSSLPLLLFLFHVLSSLSSSPLHLPWMRQILNSMYPRVLVIESEGAHTAPGAGRESWRPAAPLISPFLPILVPAFICCVEDSVFYYHLRSKRALCHPLSYLATRSWDELGLEKHPQTASPYFPSPESVPSLIYHGPTTAMINPGNGLRIYKPELLG